VEIIMDQPNRRTLTVEEAVEEAAQSLGIGRSLAYELVKRGVVPSIRLGRRIVVPVMVLDDLLASPTAS
jgi:excisionase family DNA binding protein